MNKNKQAYSEKLKDPRWQKKRLEILNRDDFTCTKCSDKETTLHIHHKKYKPGLDPWEYDNTDLATVCKYCHTILKEIDYSYPNVTFDNVKIQRIIISKLVPEVCVSEFLNIFGIFFLKVDGSIDYSYFMTIKLISKIITALNP